MSDTLRYANMTVSEAIIAYLANTGEPRTRQAVKEELRTSGALLYRGDADVDRSIAYLTMPAEAPPKLKEVGGKVGLSEWGEEKWKE